jgi:hypothetical protein
MTRGHAFGLPGIELEAGDHICALYLAERERDAVLPHTKLLLGGLVIENPHYHTPDEYLAAGN